MRRRGLVIARVTHVCCGNAFECSRCNPIFVEEIVASYARFAPYLFVNMHELRKISFCMSYA